MDDAEGQLSSSAPTYFGNWAPLFSLGLILAAITAARYPYLEIPLERDEGEFAYGGRMILAGEPPYVTFHAMKLPGIYLIYAAIEAGIGESVSAIHLGLLLANAVA